MAEAVNKVKKPRKVFGGGIAARSNSASKERADSKKDEVPDLAAENVQLREENSALRKILDDIQKADTLNAANMGNSKVRMRGM